MSNKSHKPFFMPMLCRLSQNDTVKPPKPTTSDPSSPKLTCIGQIKKRSTTTTTTINHHHHHSNRYTKLHKLFSSKNIISPTLDNTTINKLKCKSVTRRHATHEPQQHVIGVQKENKPNCKSVTYRSKSCNGRNIITPINKKKYYIDDQDIMKEVVDKELDPPLPVVKCQRRDNESNLWKRRGIEMKTLQIEPVKVNLNQKFRNNNGGFLLQTAAATF